MKKIEHSDKELLEDTSFDRIIAPKDDIKIQLLVRLLKKRVIDPKSAIIVDNVKKEILKELAELGRIIHKHHSPAKVYLTPLGILIAQGELIIRKYEKKT